MLYRLRDDTLTAGSKAERESDAFIYIDQYVMSTAKRIAVQVIESGNAILAKNENKIINMHIKVQPGKISVYIENLLILRLGLVVLGRRAEFPDSSFPGLVAGLRTFSGFFQK
jgi:hypothetical protein